jgi:hypothetical protein
MRGRVEVVWAVLVAATVLSWALGSESAGQLSSVAMLVVASAKVRLVGRYFMEIRGAHLALRAFLDAYVVLVGMAMVVVYLAG